MHLHGSLRGSAIPSWVNTSSHLVPTVPRIVCRFTVTITRIQFIICNEQIMLNRFENFTVCPFVMFTLITGAYQRMTTKKAKVHKQDKFDLCLTKMTMHWC